MNITNYISSQIKILYLIPTTFLLLHIKPTVQRHAAQLICLAITMQAHQGWGTFSKCSIENLKIKAKLKSN